MTVQLNDNRNQFTPQASRADMPEYGLLDADQGRGLLPWQWAQERLEKSHNYWVATTRPDGRPHATAVWGVWWNNIFYFSSGRLTRKARNLAHNSSCVVCIENAAEAVIVEGVAQLVSNSIILSSLHRFIKQSTTPSIPTTLTSMSVQPKVVFGFIEEAQKNLAVVRHAGSFRAGTELDGSRIHGFGVSTRRPIMVGGAVAHPTATPEPDMKLSLHPALQITGSCHEHFVGGLHHGSDRVVKLDWQVCCHCGCHSGDGFRCGLLT